MRNDIELVWSLQYLKLYFIRWGNHDEVYEIQKMEIDKDLIVVWKC